MKMQSKNRYYLELLNFLRKKSREANAPIWRRVMELLERPKRRRVAVSISKINRYTKAVSYTHLTLPTN